MQNQLERGMWAMWLPSLKGTRWRTFKEDAYEVPAYADPTVPVEDRLDYLGISKESGVGKFRGTWTSEDEVKKVITWADSYKQPKFIDK
ncbi:MAG: hypothetical protein IPM98_13335 [Lewinellaceae bacterium]|nr:hypothetical protein [Lewinellaceae bacterium]